MKAFILAAGEGTRIRPLTANTPKPLLLTAGKPFLLHTIESLKKSGIKEITILVGWKGTRIKGFFGDGKAYGVKINYLTQEHRLGTAHAIGKGKDNFKGDFICINGDVIVVPGIIKELLNFSKKAHGDNIMVLSKVANPKGYGVITLKGNNVVKIEEKPSKPKSDLVNTGIYLFRRGIFDLIKKTPKSPRGEYEITTTLEMMVKKKNLSGLVSKSEWIDIGKPWDLLDANRILMDGMKKSIKGKVEKGVTIKGTLVVEKGALIKSGTYIEGSVIICSGATIGPNSYLRGSTTIGPGSKVGAASEVKNSIIMANTNIPHHNYVGDSIIGENCNLGSGTKIANLRLDEGNIKVVLKGEYVDTGRRKLGVIMGDNVKTGINASIDVGTIIGEDSFIGPGTVAQGTYLPGSNIT
jgi:bifunctional UDP-N-acetylglucosamine pyrophosphorylase/glucosamine-1-phosphate N-acetyltransferase